MLRKLFLLFFCLATVTVFADEEEGGMVLRMDTVKLSDPKLSAAVNAGRPAAITLVNYIVDQTRQTVFDAVKQSKRFNITDIETANRLDAELRSELALNMNQDERQKLMREIARKALASDWVVEVDITQCQFTPKANGSAWTAILHISIVLKDRRDPNLRVIDTHRFVTDATVQKPKLQREDAVVQSLESIHQEMVFHFTNHFSVYAKGLGFQDDMFKISAGNNYSVKKGDDFQIYHMGWDRNKKVPVETLLGQGEVKSVTDNTALLQLNSSTLKEVSAAAERGGWIRVKSVIKDKR